jgi:hypothetical protein
MTSADATTSVSLTSRLVTFVSRPRFRRTLAAFGSLLIFGSWVSENWSKADAEGERSGLDRLTYTLVTNDALANIWGAALSTHRALPEQNPVFLKEMAINHLLFSHNVRHAALAWHEGVTPSRPNCEGVARLTEPYAYPDGEWKFIELAILCTSQDLKDQATATANVEQLLQLVRKSQSLNQAVGPQLIRLNEARYLALQRRENRAQSLFRLLYVVGAMFLGMAWLLQERSIAAHEKAA